MQNPLGRLQTFFSSLLRSREGSVLGVDIGSAYIKVVQLRRQHGKAVLETYGSLALGPYGGVEIGRATQLPAHQVAQALRDLLREAHVTTESAAFAIPFSSSLVTTMEMRVLDERNLAMSVPIEARKYVPVPISEVNLDWWVVPEEPGRQLSSEMPADASVAGAEADIPGEVRNTASEAPPAFGAADTPPSRAGSRIMRILIAAIHNEAMSRFQTIVSESGLKSSFFEIELFSTVRALFPQDLEPHAVLDLGAGETKLYIIDRGLMRLSHIINHGAQDLTLAISRSRGVSVSEAEQLKRTEGISLEEGGDSAPLRGILSVIFSETAHALHGFERRFGRAITDVVLSGGGTNLAGIETVAAESVPVAFKRANSFTAVEAPAFLDALLREIGPEFSVAVGVAIKKLQEG